MQPPYRTILSAFIVLFSFWIAQPGFAQSDRLDGVPVIDELDTEKLARGEVHYFHLRLTRNALGQDWHIPVIVVRGAQNGPRLLLANGVQGEHVTGADVIRQVVERVDPSELTGDIIATPFINIPGLLYNNHNFLVSADGGYTVNLNRLMPGDPDGSVAARFAHAYWQGVVEAKIDLAIDLHTPVYGAEYPVFVFADLRDPEVARLTSYLDIDFAKNDPGEPGTIETELVSRGIPAVTFELGSPRRLQPEMIERGVRSVLNVLAGFNMIDGEVSLPHGSPVIGDSAVVLSSSTGGIVTLLVEPGEAVRAGQQLAIVRDAFGREREVIEAPEDGYIITLAREPLREPGAMIVRLMSDIHKENAQ